MLRTTTQHSTPGRKCQGTTGSTHTKTRPDTLWLSDCSPFAITVGGNMAIQPLARRVIIIATQCVQHTQAHAPQPTPCSSKAPNKAFSYRQHNAAAGNHSTTKTNPCRMMRAAAPAAPPLPHLANAAAQVLVACSHDVALVLAHALTQAVISIRALVGAGDALHTRVLQDRTGQSGSAQSWSLQHGLQSAAP